MSRLVLYVAHPLSPTEAEIVAAERSGYEDGGGLDFAVENHLHPGAASRRALRSNLHRGMRWLAWLRKSFPETTFIAPWIATVMSLDGDDIPALREAGLVDDCAVVERCDGIVLCGGRISSGMRMEAAARRFPEHWVCDLTGLGAEPPGALSAGATFAAYVDATRREVAHVG